METFKTKGGFEFKIKNCPICGKLEKVEEHETYAISSCPDNHYARIAWRLVKTA